MPWLVGLLPLFALIAQTPEMAPSAATPVPESWKGVAGITIVATDDAGAPVAEVAVTLRLGDSSFGLRGADTGADGRSVVEGLAEGEWQIDLRREGFMLITAYVRLEEGKEPEVAFSTRQRTGSYWAPLHAVYLESGTPVSAAVAVGRTTPKQAQKSARREAQKAARAEARLAKKNRRGRTARVAPTQPVERVEKPEVGEPSAVAEESAKAPTEARPEPILEADLIEPDSKTPDSGTPAPEPAPEEAAAETSVRASSEVPTPSSAPLSESPPLLRNPFLLPAGACPECRPGEWSVTAESQAAPGGGGCSPSASDSVAAAATEIGSALLPPLRAFAGALRSADENDVVRLLPSNRRQEIRDAIETATAPSSSCPVVGVVLPEGARYIGFRYRAADRRTEGECLPDQVCQIGQSQWQGPPVITKTESITTVHGQFENRSSERSRRAILTVYFVPARGWLPPN